MVALKNIQLPLSEGVSRALSVGDNVLISGQLITARDKAHQYLFNERPDPKELPFDLEGSIIYHCGPIIKQDSSGYRIVACGPTTSARVEMYENWIIENYGVRAVMGKGGMGARTLDALKHHGGVYLHTIGGAASYLAEKIKRVVDVFKLEEFGLPEAMWLLEVEEFPAIVTMDSTGNSLHHSVQKASEEVYRRLMSPGSQRT